MNLEKFIDGLHGWLGEQFSPIVARLKALEDRPAPRDGVDGEPGKPGERGADADYSVVDGKIKDAIASIEIPQALTADEIRELVDQAVEKRFAQVRVPADGRDAADLEILKAIDLEKSYPRNTYARHDGGLWRSFETTDGMRGWECIVAGLKSVEHVYADDGRTVTVKTVMSDGASKETAIPLPTMIYRGVFKDGEQYAEGDTVTWAGSLWHANEATDEKPGSPGVKAWQLAVKRGSDGKDGRNGVDAGKAVQL